MKIILASSSNYRKKLLAPLIPTVICIAPNIDESQRSNESASDYVSRLALEKAQAVAQSLTEDLKEALIIGSDQCAVLNNKIITKPKTPEAAFQQLKESSEKTMIFYTGLCVFNTKNKSKQVSYETFKVKFRKLTAEEIKNYLDKDRPYDCAGSFKAEGLGITLFEKMEGNDFNALLGLPLIKLTSVLKAKGFNMLTQ